LILKEFVNPNQFIKIFQVQTTSYKDFIMKINAYTVPNFLFLCPNRIDKDR